MPKKNKTHIAVLMGGLSNERQISFNSGQAVIQNLDKTKYKVLPIEINTDLKFIDQLFKLKNKIDVAFIALHGSMGEDGQIQSLLDILNIPYTFSNSLSSALGMDKLKSRQFFELHKIKVPPYLTVNKKDWQKNKNKILKNVIQKFVWPIVVKPKTSGSSYGINLARNKKDLIKFINQAFKFDNLILIEKYLGKKEISVPTLGNSNPQALPVIEIVPHNDFFDLDAKYSGQTNEICPAQISSKLTQQAQAVAQQVHQILNCRGLIRTDILIYKNQLYVLETNTIPGLTTESLVPKSAQVAGINFSQLLDKIIQLALDSTN